MPTGQNQDRAQPSALAGVKFSGACVSGPWGCVCGYPRTQGQMLTIHLQFPGLWLLPSLASSPGPQIRRRRLTQVESSVHFGPISLARGCGTGHVARPAGLWLDRFLKKGSRWNNLVESSVPQFLLRQVFYSLAGDGNAFGSLRRGKREEDVLVMLILPPFSIQVLDYRGEGSVAPQLRAWGRLRNRFLCSLFHPWTARPLRICFRRFWDAARLPLRHALPSSSNTLAAWQIPAHSLKPCFGITSVKF